MATPLKEDGDMDYDAFVRSIEGWNSTKLTGCLVLDSNSETCYLNRQEREELMRLTVEYAADGKFVMAGTGLESIHQTIELTNRTTSLGAKSALILTPYSFGSSIDSNALIDYFTQVADHVGIPVLLYSVPRFTHVNIEADAVQKLASHPNTLGMKDSPGNVLQLAAYKRVAPGSFSVMMGITGAWYPASILGIKAGVHASASCHPDECVKIQEPFDGGDWEGVRDLYRRMFPVNDTVTGIYSIAGLKYSCDLMGYKGGHVRRLLQSLTDEKKTALRNIFESAGLLQRTTTGGYNPIDESMAIKLEGKATIKFSNLETQPMSLGSRYHFCYIRIRT